MRIVLSILILTLLFSSCYPDSNRNTGDVFAYVPVYAQQAELNEISTVTPIPTKKAGKIYAYGNYIFQNDINKGIHIVDNSSPSNPVKVAFINIPFSTEIAIRGSFLYTNSVSDLVVLNISNPLQPSVVKRVKDAFPLINQQYPPVNNTYFVCPDAKKGIVTDWVLELVKNPACKR
jgi:hypothetical protein